VPSWAFSFYFVGRILGRVEPSAFFLFFTFFIFTTYSGRLLDCSTRLRAPLLVPGAFSPPSLLFKVSLDIFFVPGGVECVLLRLSWTLWYAPVFPVDLCRGVAWWVPLLAPFFPLFSFLHGKFCARFSLRIWAIVIVCDQDYRVG